MSKVFLGGSRRVSRLNTDIRQRIDRIVQQNLSVIVGDANGADKAIQTYLHDRNYEKVEVFCSGGHCRNNVGNWSVRTIKPAGRPGTFSFYATKDRSMADEADYGFMLWDGKSKGTLVNVLRLLRQQKPIVVYVSPLSEFAELRDNDDWEAFASRCPTDALNDAKREAAAEIRATGRDAQAHLV